MTEGRREESPSLYRSPMHGHPIQPASRAHISMTNHLMFVSPSEQGGSQKEILDQIWVQQNRLEVLSSIRLSLASKALFPLRCFGARLGNKQWMSPIPIPFCREVEERIHPFICLFIRWLLNNLCARLCARCWESSSAQSQATGLVNIK